MKRCFAVAALALAVLTAGSDLCAQRSPRDLWPQATTAARERDFEMATKRAGDLLTTGRTYGITNYPQYAASAASLTAHAEKHNNPELAKWSSTITTQLDKGSPAVAFTEADRAARREAWGEAIPLAMRGYARVFGDYRSRTLGNADFVTVASIAILLTAILLAIALFIRYGRAMAHDFREILGSRLTGGSVSVLAFALLFLPIFFWLGPMWLLFYWLAIFFPYAGAAERIAAVVLLLLVAVVPIASDYSATRVAGVENPVIRAAIASENQAYEPEALRRLQELIAVAPNHPVLQLLAGNMQAFEGNEQQAQQHYNRAAELRPDYAGARVNIGNLLFLNNEFPAAMTEYEKAQRADAKLAAAYFNHSVASGETYKFDQQSKMLDSARRANRAFVERVTRSAPPQKVVMYSPSIEEAWDVTAELAKIPAARALFGNYATFDLKKSALNPMTIGALASLLLALLIGAKRRNGLANACIKCGRTFCHRCKSARESTTYCTQCIHIYLKRDGVSIDTKRKKLEEVTSHQTGLVRRNKWFATFLPGAAQMLEGRTVAGVLGTLLFALFVAVAVLVGRLAPALGPSADFAQLFVRVVAIALAVITWFVFALPVYRRRSVA